MHDAFSTEHLRDTVEVCLWCVSPECCGSVKALIRSDWIFWMLFPPEGKGVVMLKRWKGRVLKFFFLRKRRSQPFNCGLPLSPPPPPKPDRMECCHGRSKYHVSVTCFLFPQLPLDGSNMNHQTPQLCGVAMQGEEALNPILVTVPSLDQPSQRGMSLWVSVPQAMPRRCHHLS